MILFCFCLLCLSIFSFFFLAINESINQSIFSSFSHSTDETDSEGDTAKAEGKVVPKPIPRPHPESCQPPKLRDTKASSFGTSAEACEYSTKVRWQMSSAITTQHLLSLISIANTLMSMSRASFLMVQPQPQHYPPKR